MLSRLVSNCLLSVSAVLVAAAVPLFAQAQARLTGTVTDSTGAVIAGAQVSVRNVATGVSNTAQTIETGVFNMPFLPPGAYALTVTSTGFKTFSQTGITLETGFVRTVNIQLEIGQITETVEVTSTAPLLESETSSVGQLIEQANIINMPLESRRSASLVRLMGGVTFRQESGAEQAPQFSMFGGRSYNQMWQLDGGVAQNMTLGVAMLSVNPPAESLQEFKVESNNYSAEYGRAGGGLILMTTKSGTNEFHGSAYHFLRNDALDAREFFAGAKAKLRYNIFGASIGGPIKRDRTFFFYNYEGARRRDGVTVANRTVPRPEEKAGDFSRRRDSILDPATGGPGRAGQPFPGNVIPSSRIDPLSRKFLDLLPGPNRATDLTRGATANFNANTADKLTQNISTSRVDHTFSANDRIYGRHTFIAAPQDIGAVYPNATGDDRSGPRENRVHQWATTWFHNFTPTTIQEVRWSFMRRIHINRGRGTGSGLNGQFGVPNVNPDALARINMTGYSPIGQGNHERIQDPIINNQFIYNITKLRGSHTIKFGAELRQSKNTDDANASTGGAFTFSNRATNDGLASFLLGHTTGAAILDTLVLTTRTDYWGAFIQDDWKLSPTFTLNLGLRWELDQPRWEREDNRQNGFAFAPINPVSGTPGVVTFSARDGQSKYAHDFDKNNFGPRFGFAWRPMDKTVIRGGYGIQYLGAYKSAVPNCCALGFSRDLDFTSPDGGFTAAFPFRQGIPGGAAPAQPVLDASFGSVPLGRPTTTAPQYFQQDHPTGYAQQWNFGIQRDLGFNSVLEVAYLANVGHKLGGNNVSMNMIPLVNGRGPARQNQALRPFPQFSGVTLLTPSWGNSTYHAMNIKWEKRYSGGLNFLANYTVSKYIDDVEGNNEAGGGAGGGYTHVERRALDKSLSGVDVRNRLIASTVYDLPIGRGRKYNIDNRAADLIAGGWGIGAVLELRQGLAWGAVEQVNQTNVFGDSNRPILVGDPTLSASRSRAEFLNQWFNTAAFAQPAVGEFGNAARTYCCGPGLALLDLSVHKRFRLNERFGLMFRTDFYNLPNRPHFNLPNTTRGNPNFGRIQSNLLGSTPRRIQFSLKLEY